MNFKVNEIIFCNYTNSLWELNKEILMKDVLQQMREIGSRRYIQSGIAMELEMNMLQAHWSYINNNKICIKLK